MRRAIFLGSRIIKLLISMVLTVRHASKLSTQTRGPRGNGVLRKIPLHIGCLHRASCRERPICRYFERCCWRHEIPSPMGYFSLAHARFLLAREAGFDSWMAAEGGALSPHEERHEARIEGGTP